MMAWPFTAAAATDVSRVSENVMIGDVSIAMLPTRGPFCSASPQYDSLIGTPCPAEHSILLSYSIWHNTGQYHSFSNIDLDLLSGDDQPVCSACQSLLTIKHFLFECVNFAAIRSRHFSASSMKDVFENVNAQSVRDFIKEIHFYHEL